MNVDTISIIISVITVGVAVGTIQIAGLRQLRREMSRGFRDAREYTDQRFHESRDDIRELRRDVNHLREAVSALREAVGTLRTAVATLQTAVGTLQEAVGGLREAVGALREDVSVLLKRTGIKAG